MGPDFAPFIALTEGRSAVRYIMSHNHARRITIEIEDLDPGVTPITKDIECSTARIIARQNAALEAAGLAAEPA